MKAVLPGQRILAWQGNRSERSVVSKLPKLRRRPLTLARSFVARSEKGFQEEPALASRHIDWFDVLDIAVTPVAGALYLGMRKPTIAAQPMSVTTMNIPSAKDRILS